MSFSILPLNPSTGLGGQRLITAGLTLICCLALLLLAGCSGTRGGPIPYAEPGTFQAPDRQTAVAVESDYRIAPMDTVAVKVFRMPDLSGDFQVDLAGRISLPLIGEVPAADLTTAQLDDSLTTRFAEKYLENPDVSVGLKESARRNVTIDGAVKSAGAFPVSGSLTLMQAVALAGGVTEDANPRRIAVFRQISGQRQAAAFDLVSIRRGEMPDPRIYAGDIVVVDGSSVKAFQKQILNSIPLLAIFGPL